MLRNYCSLKFYDRLEDQYRFTARCENQCINTMIAPNYGLLPFAFARDRYWGIMESLEVIDMCDNVVYSGSGTEYMDRAVKVYCTDDTDYIVHDLQPLDSATTFAHATLEDGCYYIKLTSGAAVYYSEVFKVVSDEDIVLENLLTNGDFASGFSSWQILAGTWTIAGGYAVKTSTVDGTLMKQVITPTSDRYLYRISFDVANIVIPNPASSFIEITTGSAPGKQYRAQTNGTHIFYSNSVQEVAIRSANDATFNVTNFKVEKVIGLANYVSFSFTNGCREINGLSAYTSNPMIDYMHVDAMVVAPAYDAEIQQDENRRKEKETTFSRSFKTYRVEPEQLPEPALDALACITAFENIMVSDGHEKEVYGLEYEVSNYDFTNQWQKGECLGLCVVTFEQTLRARGGCCDTITPLECFTTFTTTFTIDSSDKSTNGIIVIEPSSPYPDNVWIELFVGPASGDTCPGPYTSTGVVISSAAFNADGLEYYLDPNEEWCVRLFIYQVGCTFNQTSSAVRVVWH